MTKLDTRELVAELCGDLTSRYGPILGPAALVKALGYRSAGAFQQALARGTVPVPVFHIEHRRGSFALARDVAAWLGELRARAIPSRGAAEHDAH